ncbi:hypothetical protein SAY86_019996 [Trapa natans]|uniref:RRM domain-containing protein n=1 Tax=Trapa natans TaxID=22666 RepID=A0AAN7LYM2_TRANT|nr:hypothetical protein SAY86_019996 [Trapa natans]
MDTYACICIRVNHGTWSRHNGPTRGWLDASSLTASSVEEQRTSIHMPVPLQVVNVKVIRNKQTGLSEGYGFVEFYSHTTAEKWRNDNSYNHQWNGSYNGGQGYSGYGNGDAALPNQHDTAVPNGAS